MRAEDKERLARRQRMLARERGESLPAPEPEQTESRPPEEEPRKADKKTRKDRERRLFKAGASDKTDKADTAAGTKTAAELAAASQTRSPKTEEPVRAEGVRGPRLGNTRPFSPILRRRARRRRLFLVALLLALLVALAWVTGVLGASLSSMGDVMDSVSLYFRRSGGWPAATGIEEPTRVEELAGGFVELDKEDVARSAPFSPATPARPWRWATPGSCSTTGRVRPCRWKAAPVPSTPKPLPTPSCCAPCPPTGRWGW